MLNSEWMNEQTNQACFVSTGDKTEDKDGPAECPFQQSITNNCYI